MEKNIPKVRERDRNEKSVPTFREWESEAIIPGKRERMEKHIPEIRESEGNGEIHSNNSGPGIRGCHSQEWTGTGIPAHQGDFNCGASSQAHLILIYFLKIL